MFIFDQLKRNDSQLRAVAIGLLVGMALLLAGLWHVQIFSARLSRTKSHDQSVRNVIIPSIRGRILDRNDQVIAENKPRFNVVLFLEEMRAEFVHERTNTVVPEYRAAHPGVKITSELGAAMSTEAAYRVISNITWQVTSLLGKPTVQDRKAFLRHYRDLTYVPFPIMTGLTTNQVAKFAEQLSGYPSMELQIEPLRSYPQVSAAFHAMGYVQRVKHDNSPDSFEGRSGLEARYDDTLSGTEGEKWVVINSMKYRQREEVVTPARAGDDLHLTIDLTLQKAAESALAHAPVGGTPRGAAVVMDVNTGDILAAASSPTMDPNSYVRGLTTEENARRIDENLKPEYNRAFNCYNPGSCFKIVTAIACFEAGVMNPNEIFDSPGIFTEENHKMKDTAAAGPYNFERAFYKSSNTYFAHYALRAGLRKLAEVGKRFHFGESTMTGGRSEGSGAFPTPGKFGTRWRENQTPDISIGQEITASPVQMAAFISCIANGGTLFWPRLVSYSVSAETGATTNLFAAGRVRDHVVVNPQYLALIRQAMFADTENPEGTAHRAFFSGDGPRLANYRVGGKTGTAQVTVHGRKDHVTWFVSYGQALDEGPRYAVVVMVEGGGSGGLACAPVAEKIYEAILQRNRPVAKN